MDRAKLMELVRRLADRAAPRSEAEVQSDVRSLLLWGPLDLEEANVIAVNLETPAGMRRRIDVEAGCALIEVKKNLTAGKIVESALGQLAGYVASKTAESGLRYVGILTDGAEWRLYHLESTGELSPVSSLLVDQANPDIEELCVWLEAILATRTAIPPSPDEIVRRLGATSSAFRLDKAELMALYRSCRDRPEVVLKRELYAKLLTTAFGTQFANDDDLFVEHTLLVVMAELIAHVVLGVSITDPSRNPTSLLAGHAFHEAGIDGVVEADFFDWVLDAEDGPSWVRALARRIARFAWKEADHDVLKVLYESIIDAPQRHRLGEYYTPDWLAERIVKTVVSEPLSMRCADVSCGSGTFLFHAIRYHLTQAERAGLSNREAIHSVVGHICGIDVHPVAVTLARVTYLLAIGTERLAGDYEEFSIPVYLGDSIQWRHEQSLLSEGHVAVKTSEGGGLFSEDLRFPERTLADADTFDRLVTALTNRATDPGRPRGVKPPIETLLDDFQVEGVDRDLLEDTFRQLCDLRDEGRNHIWGYYVRNLVRPVWLAQEENRVDVLIGNPPWLSYRFMTPPMQEAFKNLSAERGLWTGSKVATHQDLSAFFVARAIELYLKPGGRFGYVMPEAVLSRLAYAGFRSGDWMSATAHVRVEFETPWSLGRLKPPVFRVPSCVVLGNVSQSARVMPTDAAEWRGKRPEPNASWEQALETISERSASIGVASDCISSPYHAAFTQGATIVPRMLLVVEDAPAVGILGTSGGRRRVTSRRDPQEKKPWKFLPPLTGAVEGEFLRSLHVGKTILPFRSIEPQLAVIPWDGRKLLSGDDPDIARHPGLEKWWREAEGVWNEHRSSERLSLLERIDYQRGLAKQFPIPEHRVVYSASGQYLAAARLDDPNAIVEHVLYWAPCRSSDEARFLCAVFNSQTLTRLVEPLQPRGEHNPRHFDKYVFQLPIPLYDESNVDHVALAALGARAEEIAAGLEVPKGMRFEIVRRHFREALQADGVLGAIDDAVTALLGDAS